MSLKCKLLGHKKETATFQGRTAMMCLRCKKMFIGTIKDWNDIIYDEYVQKRIDGVEASYYDVIDRLN